MKLVASCPTIAKGQRAAITVRLKALPGEFPVMSFAYSLIGLHFYPERELSVQRLLLENSIPVLTQTVTPFSLLGSPSDLFTRV